jgi:hypothetical protein
VIKGRLLFAQNNIACIMKPPQAESIKIARLQFRQVIA